MIGHRRNIYHLFASQKVYDSATAKESKISDKEYGKLRKEISKLVKKNPSKTAKKERNKNKKPDEGMKEFIWSERTPFTVRAMVATPDYLIIAGVPDLGKRPENSKHWEFENPDEALEAFQGKKGAYVRVHSMKDGKMTMEFALEDTPVWDGMSAANGKVFISQKNGQLSCYGK